MENFKKKLLPLFENHFQLVLKFSIAGTLTAIVYFGGFAFCWSYLKINHILSVSFSYSAAAFFHFLVNRNFTFKSVEKKYIYQFSKYLILLIINYCLTLIIFEFCLNYLNSSHYLGLFSAAIATAITGYLISKYWIFKNHFYTVVGEQN